MRFLQDNRTSLPHKTGPYNNTTYNVFSRNIAYDRAIQLRVFKKIVTPVSKHQVWGYMVKKIKLSLCLFVKHYTMNAYGGVDV
jgi:hypothetical protein